MKPSSRYLLEAHRTPATVVDVAGREREGWFFLRAGGTPARVESLIDLLGDEQKRFLPFETAGGIELLAVAAIVYAAFEWPEAEAERLDEIGVVRTRVALEMASGHRLAGLLVHEAPASVHRVSDLLNFTRSRFVTLLGDGRAYAVHLGAILNVRPED